MEKLPQEIFKFAKVISTSHKSDIDKVFFDNEIETGNSRYSFNWDLIYRDIADIAKKNDLTLLIMDMGALWKAIAVIIDRVLYVFLMQERFEDLTDPNKYEKHHYLTCIARSKNSHLNGKEKVNGKEKNTLSTELFNDLDDDELSKLQIEKAMKLLGEHYDLIDEVRVITFNKKTQEVRVNQVNAFCEFVDAVNITEFDFTKLEEVERENIPEKPLVALNSQAQKERQSKQSKQVGLPKGDEDEEEDNEKL